MTTSEITRPTDFSSLTFQEVQAIESKALEGFADNGHSLISPSGIGSWSKCLGVLNNIHSTRASNPDNKASIEGTGAHFILEICLRTNTQPRDFSPPVIIPDDIQHDIKKWAFNVSSKDTNPEELKSYAITLANLILNGTVSDEYKDELQKIVDVVEYYRQLGYIVIAEAKVSLYKYLWHKQCDGTSDIVLYNPEIEHLIIADLKYGLGVEVFAEDNGQLQLYCLGVCAMLFDKGFDVSRWTIDIVVCQPRISNRYWDCWRTDYPTIFAFAEKVKPLSWKALWAIGNREAITVEDYHPSVSACRFCVHRTNCNPRADFAITELRSTLSDAGIVLSNDLDITTSERHADKTLPELVSTISSPKLANIFKAKKFIEAVLNDVAVEVYERMKNNNPVEGVKLVAGRSSRKWGIKDSDLEIALKKAGIYEASLIKKLPSPTQFEKLKLPLPVKAKIMEHVNKVSGSPVLALTGDRRPDIKVAMEKEAQDIAAKSGIIINN